MDSLADLLEGAVADGGATASPAGLRQHRRAFSRAYREASRDWGRMRSRGGVPPPEDDDADSGAEES